MDENARLLVEMTYNMLSEERAKAAYMWRNRNASESLYYEARWDNCVDDMKELEESARKDGYKFTFTDFKKVGKFQYQVYKIVPISNAQGDEI